MISCLLKEPSREDTIIVVMIIRYSSELIPFSTLNGVFAHLCLSEDILHFFRLVFAFPMFCRVSGLSLVPGNFWALFSGPFLLNLN